MLAFAPRIRPRLLEALARLEDPALPIAEINRRLGREAEWMGLRRPSYQRIRVLVHELRAARRRSLLTASIRWQIAVQARPAHASLEAVTGLRILRLRR